MKAILKTKQGMALVVIIMVMLILLSITGAGLLFSGLDLKTTSQHRTGTTAFYATEAGLSHAWRELENGDGVNDFATVFSSGATAVSPFSVTSFGGGSYTVTALAVVGSNPNRVKVTSTGCLPAGNPCPSGNSKAVIEAEFKKESGKPNKAIVVNGDLKISGGPSIMGTRGGAHTNEDMEVSGSPGIQMADGLTASNKTTNDGGIHDGMKVSGSPCIGSSQCSLPPGQQPDANKIDTADERNAYEAAHNSASQETIPKINPADYAPKVAAMGANHYILHDNGTVTTGPGVTCGTDGLCSGGTSVVPVPAGWEFEGGKWKVDDDSAANGVFYSEVKVEVSGSPGSSGSPWQATIIARDDIKISSGPHIKPYPTTSDDLKNHLLVTGNDLEISGSMTADYAGGAILVHQQFKISSSAKINGFIIAGDGQPTWTGDPFTNSGSGVSKNEISGSATITYNADFDCFGPGCLPATVKLVTWREVF
ncbi:MAG: pilus assembly PilX N-terminal domain-containing protein [Deltaproteobacteria bacterium]|nr:pilus assembly PilX N-terminal domain-containing protein [Deltaproteobacteria bacterium]